jgi:hypothetical protein
MRAKTQWAIGCLLFVWTQGAIGLHFQIPRHIQTALEVKTP